MYLIGFPLLIIPFAIYNMIAFLTPGVNWTDVFTSVNLMSGATWTVTAEDLLIGLALILLPLEIFKAARIGNRSIVDHILSMTLFVVMLVNLKAMPEAHMDPRRRSRLGFVVASAILLEISAILVYAARRADRMPLPAGPGDNTPMSGNTEIVGWLLYTDYLVPFELASMLLLVAMIGAIILARREV